MLKCAIGSRRFLNTRFRSNGLCWLQESRSSMRCLFRSWQDRMLDRKYNLELSTWLEWLECTSQNKQRATYETVCNEAFRYLFQAVLCIARANASRVDKCASQSSRALTAIAVVTPLLPILTPVDPYEYIQPDSQPPSSHCMLRRVWQSLPHCRFSHLHTIIRAAISSALPLCPTRS